MIEVRFHPEAQAEYQDALIWYQARSLQASARFEAEVEGALGRIAANPGMFPVYDDNYRFVMLKRFPYSLVYQVLPDRIEIIAVAHSRRSSGYWRGRA